ncbi:sulfatase-like hydrolase/transferase [Stenotrophomonas sp. ISL-67]|nr:sulfatase-like hydrolase/transferase [Stenotrophomonas sp. ISL-67]
MRQFYSVPDLAWFSATCILELALLEMMTRLALRPRRAWMRAIALVPMAAAGCIYIGQLYSIWISGGMIPPIAFANNEVTGLISFNGIYLLIGLFLLAAFLNAVLRRTGDDNWSARPLLLAIVITGGVYAAAIHSQPLARGIVVARGEAPVSSFLRAVATYAGMNAHAQLSAAEMIEARKSFSRRTTYHSEFPENLKKGLPEHPNVIVIFTEGMSARWMGTYGGVHPGLTPNLDALAAKSLVFSNYYNHTAATFRGLRGQLTSGHQEIDGFNKQGTGIGQRDVSHDITAISRISVADILRTQGYQSMFFLSQQEYINKMIDTLGFDRTLGRDYLYDHHIRTAPGKQPKYLTDEQLFDAMLSELEGLPGNKRFFAAAYNFQTHAFLDGEAKYAGADNPMLNRFHTYDRDIGKFLQRFMASPLHENTVLVFTTDHSTYPSPDVVKADGRMKGYFVDTIPLLVYWKGIEHSVIDVGGKNSLDLAPTILSLLDVRKSRNLFLGCTLFESCSLDRISNIGGEYILTDGNDSYSESLVPAAQKDYYDEGKRIIERYKSMDLIIDSR